MVVASGAYPSFKLPGSWANQPLLIHISYFKMSYIRQSHPFIFGSIAVALLSLFVGGPWQPYLTAILSIRSSSVAPVVMNTRTNVSYRGTSVRGVEQFQNIFYAEDTSGGNRFAPPVPYTPSPGTIVDATAPGAACPQGAGAAPLPFTSPITNVSENCLSLRIARPAGIKVSAKLPVMVWIHGGMLKALCRQIQRLS